jgi:CotS family spore coat protein
MNDFISAALSCFGLKSFRTVKEKGAHICNTASGLIKLAKVTEPPQGVRLAHAVKEHVAEAGFLNTDRYFTGPDGLPYVHLGADLYTATYINDGGPLDFLSSGDVLTAVSYIAGFHAAARGVEAEWPTAPSREDIFNRGLETLRQALKQTNRKQRSDFDILLIKNASAYEDRIIQAMEQLAATPYADMYTHAAKGNHICHNALKEESIFINGGEAYLTRFTSVERNTQINDLAFFIRRYFQHCEGDHLPVPRLLEAYEKSNPLPYGSEAALHALLLYPAPFIKIVEQYYARKRNWTPAGLMERMREILED